MGLFLFALNSSLNVFIELNYLTQTKAPITFLFMNGSVFCRPEGILIVGLCPCDRIQIQQQIGFNKA